MQLRGSCARLERRYGDTPSARARRALEVPSISSVSHWHLDCICTERHGCSRGRHSARARASPMRRRRTATCSFEDLRDAQVGSSVAATPVAEECAPDWFNVGDAHLDRDRHRGASSIDRVGRRPRDDLRSPAPDRLVVPRRSSASRCSSTVCDASAVYLHDPRDRRAERGATRSSRRSRAARVNSVTPGGNLGEALKVGLLAQQLLAPAASSPRSCTSARRHRDLARRHRDRECRDRVHVRRAADRKRSRSVCGGGVVSACSAAAIVVLVRRGMLSDARRAALARLHIISKKRRHERWNKTARGSRRTAHVAQDGGSTAARRSRAIACRQLLQKGLTYVTVYGRRLPARRPASSSHCCRRASCSAGSRRSFPWASASARAATSRCSR